MTAALANIITSLRLIEMEDNGPRTKLLLGLATRATEEQQRLIHRILAVFEHELRVGLTNGGADGQAALRRAFEQAGPLFAEKGVRLDGPNAASGAVQISLPAAHLERVMTNLLENALERTPAGGRVVITAKEEPESLLWQVEDSGPVIDPDACANLFVQWDPVHDSAPAIAMRLHFCRIVAQNCGGEIGCQPLAEGGNRFWIRLTKSEAA